MIVAPSLGQAPVPAGSEVAFARRLFTAQKDLTGAAVTDEARTTRGDAVVVRLRGTGTDTKTGRTLGIRQTMVFEGGRYLRVLGFADAARTDALDRAERVAHRSRCAEPVPAPGSVPAGAVAPRPARVEAGILREDVAQPPARRREEDRHATAATQPQRIPRITSSRNASP